MTLGDHRSLRECGGLRPEGAQTERPVARINVAKAKNVPRRRGVTLVEVLVTLTVLAVVLPPVMYGIRLATDLAGVTQQRAQATALAQYKLHELALANQWQGAVLAGDFAPDWSGYRWQAAVDPWEEADLRQITVSVFWARRGVQRDVTLSTLTYLAEEALP